MEARQSFSSEPTRLCQITRLGGLCGKPLPMSKSPSINPFQNKSKFALLTVYTDLPPAAFQLSGTTICGRPR